MNTIDVIVVSVKIEYGVHFARCHVQLGALFCSNLLCVVFARLKGNAENEVAPGLGACAYIACVECLLQERRIVPRHKVFVADGLVAVDGRLARVLITTSMLKGNSWSDSRCKVMRAFSWCFCSSIFATNGASAPSDALSRINLVRTSQHCPTMSTLDCNRK